MNFDKQQLRDEIHNYLKENLQSPIDLANLHHKFEDQYGNKKELESYILDFLHLLEVNDIIRHGNTLIFPNYQMIVVTEYGKECLKNECFLPADPESYLQGIKNLIPDLDEITFEYISESISAYYRNCLLSATICLGVASEQLILRLIEEFTNYISDSFKTKLEKEEQSSLYKRYKVFKEVFKGENIPAELKKDSDIYLDTIFNFIRINRNEAGHPTGSTMVKSIVYSNLQIFSQYAKKVTDLINYFETKNKTGAQNVPK